MLRGPSRFKLARGLAAAVVVTAEHTETHRFFARTVPQSLGFARVG